MKTNKGPDFEKLITSLETKLENVNDAVNERIFDSERNIESLNRILDETGNIANKADMCGIKLTQNLDSVKTKLDLLDQAFNGFMVPSNLLNGGNDASSIDVVKESLASLRREFFKYKDECSANFALIGDTFSKNADKHDLKDLENRLSEKIDHNEKIMIKNKAEIRRIIKESDDKFKRINGVQSSRVNSINRDDAMLAKKHEGWK